MNKLKKLFKCCSVILILAIATIITKPVYAETTINPDSSVELSDMEEMQPYVKVIEEINQEYGICLTIPTNEDFANPNFTDTKTDVYNRLLSMSTDEFKNSITSQLNNVLTADEVHYSAENEAIEGISQDSGYLMVDDSLKSSDLECATALSAGYTLITWQTGYFNYGQVYLQANIMYTGSDYIYTGVVKAGSSYPGFSPYFIMDSYNYSYTGNQTICQVTYTGRLYISNLLLLDSNTRTYTMSFRANGGDVYATYTA